MSPVTGLKNQAIASPAHRYDITDICEEPLYSRILPLLGCRSIINLACTSHLFKTTILSHDPRKLLSHLQPPRVTVKRDKPGYLRIQGGREICALEACHVGFCVAFSWQPASPPLHGGVPLLGLDIQFGGSAPAKSTSAGLAVLAAHHLLDAGRKMPTRTAILGELTLRGNVRIPHRFGDPISAQEASAALHEAWDQGVSTAIITSNYIGKNGFDLPVGMQVQAIENTADLRRVLDTYALAEPGSINEVTWVVY